MKVEQLEKLNFKSIDLKITIETEEELCDLWHRMNESKSLFKDNSLKHNALPANANKDSFFTILDNLIELNNLKNR